MWRCVLIAWKRYVRSALWGCYVCEEVWKCHDCLPVAEKEIDLNFEWKCEEYDHLAEEMEEAVSSD
eukprot:7371775-Ditylum_brightwellii.AAC.1